MRRQWMAPAIGIAAVLVAVAPVTAAFAGDSHGGARPASEHRGSGVLDASPGAVSLSGWDLSIPRNANGGTSGDAQTLSPARLDSPWLTRTSNGGLKFWAPANGARLGESAHARTELRGTGTFVLGHGSASLTETVRVTKLPSESHHIIIGQMFPSGSTPFAELHFQDNKLYGFVHDQTTTYVLMDGIPLGATFSDSIKANGDTVTMSVTYKGKTVTKQLTGISSWIGQTMHFQAGDYQQDVPGGSASDGGRLVFTALSESGVH